MYEFGLRCKETERYETEVPYMFCRAAWLISQDSQNPLGVKVLTRPGLYEEADDLCQRYYEFTKDDKPALASWWQSVNLGFAYTGGKIDRAAELLDQIDEKVDDNAFSRFPINRDQAVLNIRLQTSPDSQKILNALATDDKDPVEEKMEGLSTFAEKDSLHPLVRNRVSSRLQGLRWQVGYRADKQVGLQPNADLHGWRPIAGKWESNDRGDLKGLSHTDGVIAMCETDLGSRWQLEGEWKYGKSPYSPWYAGVILYCGGRPTYSVMYNPSKKWVAAGPYRDLDDYQQPVDFKLRKRRVPFRIQFDEGRVDFWMNGEQVIKQKRLPGWKEVSPVQVAVGAKYKWHGSELIYRKLKVKKLE